MSPQLEIMVVLGTQTVYEMVQFIPKHVLLPNLLDDSGIQFMSGVWG